MKHYNLLLIGFCCLLSCKESNSGQEESSNQQEYSYSGIGYVTGLEQPGANVLFTTEVPQAGDYLLTIRYKNQKTENATISLLVNNIPIQSQWRLPASTSSPQLSVSTDRSLWQKAEQTIFLWKGINDIVLCHDVADNGLLELDYIELLLISK